jgi:hypothetical protein
LANKVFNSLIIAPLKLTGLAGRAAPGAPGPGGGPPGGPPGGGGGTPGGPPGGGGGAFDGVGALLGALGAETMGADEEDRDLIAVRSLLTAFNLVSNDVSFWFIVNNDWSTRSGILRIIDIIFSTISPKAFTLSSIGDFRALSKKLENSSAHIFYTLRLTNSNNYIFELFNKFKQKLISFF